MSGHSHWASIKHKKTKEDAKRGKLFSKLIREITIAAKQGGGNPESNPRLRLAIERAKQANMPQENIKKAIMRGTGQLPGATFEEVTYEGYGPGGVAVMVIATTDNKNRTTAEIRKIFAKHGGSLGEVGCVNWMFKMKGVITVPKGNVSEDELLEIALSSGAEDMKDEGTYFEILTTPEDFEKVKKAIEDKKIPVEEAKLSMVPNSTVKLEGHKAEQMLKLMNELEDHDDVNEVYANFDIPDELIEKIA
ncbi:MAG: YebC/PmpR family DNA-binding transcriptional regulator [Caldiserica bacterium]|mgnify:CR=1 FL=1|nr:MAG: YebC/PmpR family DNA-binding transcriptional regulator [Caldisericota bacterium]